MRLFKKTSKEQILTEKEVAEHKKRIEDISAQVERGNFEEATKLAAERVEDFRGNDPYGEAFCRYLVGHSIICQHFKNVLPSNYLNAKMASSDYEKAGVNLRRSVEMFGVLARNKKFERNRQLLCATVLVDVGMLESFVEKWDEAKAACTRSYEICERYGDSGGMRLAAQMLLNLTEKRIFFEYRQLAKP
jgi:hypothetical protein